MAYGLCGNLPFIRSDLLVPARAMVPGWRCRNSTHHDILEAAQKDTDQPLLLYNGLDPYSIARHD